MVNIQFNSGDLLYNDQIFKQFLPAVDNLNEHAGITSLRNHLLIIDNLTAY